jgi:hypothetical protein
MAKVSKKSEKITAFGGIFFVLDKFDRILSSVIDSHLGLRSKLIGYQYSEESWGQVFDSIITFLAYRRLSREVH